MESRRITTSLPSSVNLFARSIASLDTCVCSSGGLSKVENITSPSTDLCISVTSSGLSSTRTTIKCTSGLLAVIELAISFRIVVLPALGGDTINPLWPLPIGAIKSIILPTIFSGLPGTSNIKRSSGNRGVSLLKSTRLASNSGSAPLTTFGSINAGNFSFCLGALMGPSTKSPLRILYFLILPAGT